MAQAPHGKLTRRKRDLPPLITGVKRATYRIHSPDDEEGDEEFGRARARVLLRDQYTCSYCGFRTKPDKAKRPGGYLEVHHIDDNHRNHEDRNLVTVCRFCHQVFHCGFAGHERGAEVIWLPWLSQSRLNLLVNLLAVTQARGGDLSVRAKELYMVLRSYSAEAARIFGDEITDAANLGTVLMSLGRISAPGRDYYAARTFLFGGLRLLPVPDTFHEAVAYWVQHDVWLPESQWSHVYNDWLSSRESK